MPATKRAVLTRRRALGAALGTVTAAALSPAAPAAASAAPPNRHIRQVPLQGAVNVRDIGGYRAAGGSRVRYGQVYRADALSKLTDADLTTLENLRLRQAVDFRVPLEVRYDGTDRLPAGITGVARPVTDNGLYARILTAIASRDPVQQEEMLGGGRAAAFMRSVYPMFVTGADNRARFAATLHDIAYGGRGALLYHCTSGKDRTGWTTYVLLRLLGVSQRAAVEDYLASNTFRAAYDAKLRESLGQSGAMQDPDLLIPLQEVRTDYLTAALDQVRTDYGSLHRYVAEGLGVDRRTAALLRARLVY
ncbi:tyrosine-protein phosphatase [Streptomyces longispororuber]|uniref:tyrosine-protein phosphatase n=1 Tax=Streptomyces longispororuber TaxID=68230 RepID=UPI002109916A|nr:tyrosine-protein phosphatase [Streptomyces longispororuber]MCQ4205876.1 tyrosine-protein phosphatase [Streptomyces longispororuber]